MPSQPRGGQPVPGLPPFRHHPGRPCATLPYDWFTGESRGSDGGLLHLGKAACLNTPCPVLRECLHWALEHNELGVWGGTDEADRGRLRYRARQQPQPPDVDDTTPSRGQELADAIARLDRAALTTREIADRLGVNIRTVSRHRTLRAQAGDNRGGRKATA